MPLKKGGPVVASKIVGLEKKNYRSRFKYLIVERSHIEPARRPSLGRETDAIAWEPRRSSGSVEIYCIGFIGRDGNRRGFQFNVFWLVTCPYVYEIGSVRIAWVGA
jgi:hypothetical protein